MPDAPFAAASNSAMMAASSSWSFRDTLRDVNSATHSRYTDIWFCSSSFGIAIHAPPLMPLLSFISLSRVASLTGKARRMRGSVTARSRIDTSPRYLLQFHFQGSSHIRSLVAEASFVYRHDIRVG